MLADSPDSPESEPMFGSDEADTTPTNPPVVNVPKDEDDSPLREKKTGRNVATQAKGDQVDEKKRTSKVKAKAKVEPVAPAIVSKPKTVGAREKENRDKTSRRGSPPMLGAPSAKPSSTLGTSQPETAAKAATKAPAKLPPIKGGARRVPIGSAEAAALPGWRG
jgi:hypothetical protein